MLSTLKLGALEAVTGNLFISGNHNLGCDADAIIGQVSASEAVICENAPDSSCGPDECPDIEQQ